MLGGRRFCTHPSPWWLLVEPWPMRMSRPRGRACLPSPPTPVRSPIWPLKTPTPPAFPPPARALMPVQLSTLPRGFAGVLACLMVQEPAQVSQEISMDIMCIGLIAAPGISSVSLSRVVQDDTIRLVYLDTITTSIGRVVLSGPDPDAPSAGPTIEGVIGKE